VEIEDKPTIPVKTPLTPKFEQLQDTLDNLPAQQEMPTLE
jgi:hypothetical protein